METYRKKQSWAFKAVFGAIFTILFAIIAVGAIMHFHVNRNNQDDGIEPDETYIIGPPTIDEAPEI